MLKIYMLMKERKKGGHDDAMFIVHENENVLRGFFFKLPISKSKNAH